MELESVQVDLFRLAAKKLKGPARRAFVAEVVLRLCDGKVRQAEDRFGWNRATIRKGLQERESGEIIAGHYAAAGRQRYEDRSPRFAEDVRDIAESKTQTDPELKSDRRYLNLTSAEVRSISWYSRHDAAYKCGNWRACRRAGGTGFAEITIWYSEPRC